MNTKTLIRCALAVAITLLAASCLAKQDYSSQYESNILVEFEPQNYYEWEEFLASVFGDDSDTVAFHPSVAIGPMYHIASFNDADEFQGGLVLCRGKDSDASAGRKPSRFAVYDKSGGHNKSNCYAVFHDTTATLMPERCILVSLPNKESNCSLNSMYVHNVQAAVQAAMTGAGLSEGPFQAGDFLTLTVTGYNDSKVTGSVECKLIDGTQVVNEWKLLETSSLGSIDAVDFHLSSSRVDFPLYCCMDDMLYHYYELYR